MIRSTYGLLYGTGRNVHPHPSIGLWPWDRAWFVWINVSKIWMDHFSHVLRATHAVTVWVMIAPVQDCYYMCAA